MFNISIECPHCNKIVENNWSEFIVSSDVIDEDRGMGAETEHTIECSDYECPHCHKTFNVNGSVYEYPIGAYNDDTLCAEI